MIRPRSTFRRLPLVWKLLVPFLALLLVVGPAAALLVVRDLTSRAQAGLDRDLLQEALTTRSRIHDHELHLVEAANFAANVQGMADAVRADDDDAAAALLRSVLALKPELEFVAVISADGDGLVALQRDGAGGEVREGEPRLPAASTMAELPSGPDGTAAALLDADEVMLAVAAPVCAGVTACDAVGTALAATSVAQLVGDLGSSVGGLALYAADGARIAARGPSHPTAPPPVGEQLLRRNDRIGGEEQATLFVPVDVQARRLGSFAVSLPAGPAFGAARTTAMRLGVALLMAMAAVVGIGVVLSRSILAQVRALVATSRSLADGDLAARVPVLADDEVGELAVAVNHMAAELQASHETLETRVDERTREVHRLLRERTELFASLSHELRTPIAIILSEAKMRRDPTYRRRGGQTAAWTAVEASAGQLLAHVNAILELARAESGRLEVHPTDVAVHEALAPVWADIERLTAAGGIGLDVDVPDDLPTVRVDVARLHQILVNLVDNAVKYTAPGGRVGVSAAPRNGHIDLSISDTGIGIPNDVGDQVFEPFYRVEEARTHAGQPSTGLGLALAKRLVEAQDARITYMSEPGCGSTFTITLARASKGTLHAQRAGVPAQSPDPDRRGP